MDDRPIAYDAYQLMAERYAEAVKTKPHNAYLERPAIRALVPDVTGARVLDAGCGGGINIGWLIEQGAREVVGIDVSPNMIAIAARQAGDNVTLHVADMSQPMNFLAGESFDLVWSSLAVHYIEDQRRLFAEFARVLRPGGRFVFSTDHPSANLQRHPGNYYDTVLITEHWRMGGQQPTAVSFYRRPLSAITEALSAAGFVIERLTEARPTEDFRRADPDAYAFLMENPSFMCVRARKLP